MSTTITETATLSLSNTAPQAAPVDLGAYDDEQVRLMEERCILVTPADEAYGDDSKKTCKSLV
jgi:isopentenyl-diphosphate delta-isomerase